LLAHPPDPHRGLVRPRAHRIEEELDRRHPRHGTETRAGERPPGVRGSREIR
jgi:hypothetical protein